MDDETGQSDGLSPKVTGQILRKTAPWIGVRANVRVEQWAAT